MAGVDFDLSSIARTGSMGLGSVSQGWRMAGHAGVSVVSGQFPGLLHPDALDEWLDGTVGAFGPQLLRIKAILNVAGYDRPLVLHGVQHVVHPPEQLPPAAWSAGSNRLLLTARGVEQSVPEDALHNLSSAALMALA